MRNARGERGPTAHRGGKRRPDRGDGRVRAWWGARVPYRRDRRVGRRPRFARAALHAPAHRHRDGLRRPAASLATLVPPFADIPAHREQEAHRDAAAPGRRDDRGADAGSAPALLFHADPAVSRAPQRADRTLLRTRWAGPRPSGPDGVVLTLTDISALE